MCEHVLCVYSSFICFGLLTNVDVILLFMVAIHILRFDLQNAMLSITSAMQLKVHCIAD